jgi:hypothetical protein
MGACQPSANSTEIEVFFEYLRIKQYGKLLHTSIQTAQQGPVQPVKLPKHH